VSRRLAAIATMALLILAACSAGTGTPSAASAGPSPTAAAGASAAGSISASSTVVPSATPAPSTGAPSASSPASPSAVAVACSETTRAGTIAVRIEDFSFTPDTIRVRVGQVIRFTNAGFESHNATVDGGCRTETLATGAQDGLVFKAAGSVAFHCSIHTWMTGTITIS
jgi:plastocyanin